MDETFEESGVTLKFGVVLASQPGFARVSLPDTDNLRTMWLPIAYPKTQDDECYWTYDTGEHVALLLDAQGEDGVIIGAIFSDADTPPVTDPNKFGIRFKDGAMLEYDRQTHTLSVTGVSKVIVEASTTIVLKAGSKVTIDSPEAEFTGKLQVDGLLTYLGGLEGSGGGGSKFTGRVDVDGDVHATGSIIDVAGNSNHHSHT
ncbi:phage baseplate assembly protein V [Iodobacter fluviatilis]|uniref:Phage P2 baseplate assembly protein gpV n=1 Tax=Iodobacter fluviatilis TaxID=537 RepID=A0A377Q832_9NEIS|nr:phage baseplate assembly protein V [Iodobacter fluviatilis]TCU88515.1 phage baseplate assembly protein V [Iodobacter fluviatilis]STQ91414.1 Phage P2 baseplate assembly protein gpV [Iodobacter fluviatilis]